LNNIDPSYFNQIGLGIIALFIILAETFASLVVGFSGKIGNGHQWLLVGFVVIFPLIVLSIFTWLVTRHHSKLYAPTDFRSDESFYRTFPIKGVLSSQAEIEVTKIETKSNTELLPESISSITKIDNEKLARRYKILRAEDLALRSLELYVGEPVRRQSVITAPDGPIYFNGLSTVGDMTYAADVRYTNDGIVQRDTIDSLLHKSLRANFYLKTIGQKLNVKLILIYDTKDNNPELIAKIKAKILQDFNNGYIPNSIPVECEVIAFDLLDSKYDEVMYE
jgi:hypothetical protein